MTATYNFGKDAVLIDGFSFDTGNMLETTDFHEVVLSYTENNATVNCSVQISLSHDFVRQCTDPSFLLDNEYSDLEALFYHSCACGEHNETSFVHAHSFNEEDICRDCGFYFENSHLLEIKNNIITGLTVDASSISGKLILPNGITGIDASAFSGCSSLTSIEIPSSVTSIGSSAFYGCNGLVEPIVLKGKLLRGIVIDGIGIVPEEVTSIGDSAFSGCSGLTSIEIPSSVTSIEDYAFSGCSGLTSIEIPSSVTSIGDSAFYGCNGLVEPIVLNGKLLRGIVIDGIGIVPEEVTSIGRDAFYGCSGLTSIEIPSSVTSIGDRAFYGCSGLKEITLPFVGGSKTSNTYLGYIFGASSYSDNSYYVPSSLKRVVISGGVTSIGGRAFYGCSGLTSIEIPSSVTSIGDSAFSGCSGLTSIEIPSSVTSIGYSAFYGCSGLTSIEIPSSVTSIGWYAFSYTSSSLVVKINKPYNSLNGSPWGALGTIIWAK